MLCNSLELEFFFNNATSASNKNLKRRLSCSERFNREDNNAGSVVCPCCVQLGTHATHVLVEPNTKTHHFIPKLYNSIGWSN
jgi:hypothetical protein